MAKYVLIGCLIVACPTVGYAQTVGGGGSIALPEIQITNPNDPFNPYNGKFDGVIGETSDITGVNKPILDIPRSVYVVTPQTLQEQMPQSLAEAVQSIPGTYTGNQGGGNSDLITIKGFQTGTTDSFIVGNDNGLLIDGIRAPFDRVFNANTQSVELISGPDSYLYGYTDEGGVLNVQRKQPLPDAHYAADILGGAVTGSFKDVAGSFDFTGPIYKSVEGVLAYRLVGSAANDQPWRIGDTVSRDFLMAPTFAYYSNFVTATVAYEHEQNQQPYDRGDTSINGQAVLNIPATESYSEPYSVYNEKLDWIHGKVDLNLDKSNEIHFKYSYSSTALNFAEIRSDNQTDFDPATGIINRYFYYNNPDGQQTKQAYVQLRGVQRFDTGPIKNEFNEGVDYYDQHLNEQAEYSTNLNFMTGMGNLPFNFFSPSYGQLPSGPVSAFFGAARGPDGDENTQKNRELGAFAQESATFGLLTISGGGRYTTLYTYENYLGNTEDDNTVHRFLPSGSLLFKITDTVSVFADYAQSIHPNIFSPQLVTSLYGPVVPETGEGEEAGIKAKFLDGRILAQASGFSIEKKNVADEIELAGTNGSVEDLESFGQTQRSVGIATSVLGNVTPNFDVNLTYNHQDVRVISDYAINMDMDAQVTNAPANTYSAILGYHFHEGMFNHLSFTAQVYGASGNPAATLTDSFKIPAYTILNLGTSYTIDRGPKFPIATISLKCNNVADAKYYPASGTKTNWITVGEPRNFLVDLNMAM